MKSKLKNDNIKLVLSFVFLIYLFGFLKERYFFYYPTIPLYPDNYEEINIVKQFIDKNDNYFINLFKKTDVNPCYAFQDIIPNNCKKLNNIIQKPHIIFTIFFLKLFFNRARPYQINDKLNIKKSLTANTPAFPSGHCIQSLYLANVLSLEFPEKKEDLINLAKNIALSRVYAGLHYPSDNEFGEKIANILFIFYNL
tara:strand:+ start:11108 stop:11698 length:591 start_codon:yes stop_codon:yes gene_type:complete